MYPAEFEQLDGQSKPTTADIKTDGVDEVGKTESLKEVVSMLTAQEFSDLALQYPFVQKPDPIAAENEELDAQEIELDQLPDTLVLCEVEG